MNGDEHAFYQLVLHWQKPVMNFLAKHMGNTDDARELAQETFKTIYEKLPSLPVAEGQFKRIEGLPTF